jgi:hypothetical protein
VIRLLQQRWLAFEGPALHHHPILKPRKVT